MSILKSSLIFNRQPRVNDESVKTHFGNPFISDNRYDSSRIGTLRLYKLIMMGNDILSREFNLTIN